MKQTKPQVKMSNKSTVIVRYKNKDWDIKELLEFMALKIKDLEKNQCKPCAKCLFKGQKYLEEKYIAPEAQLEFPYYG